MSNYETWITVADKDERKKSWEFSTFFADSHKKNDQTIIFKPNVNKHSQIWKSATWKQLSVCPVGLTKTLQEFDMAAPTTTTASKKCQPTRRKYQPVQVRRCFKNSWRKDLCRRVRSSACSLIKKKTSRDRYFPAKLLRTRFLSNNFGRLFLEEHKI